MSNLTEITESDINEKIVIVDGHNLIFRTLFIADKNNNQFGTENDSSFSYWKYVFFKSIMGIITQFEPTKFIIAMDSKNIWRKDYYKEYKAQRKSARDNSKIDFEKFFPVLDVFYSDIVKLTSNVMHLKVDRCEGDDIIAVVTRVFKDSKIDIISTDRDLNQTLKNKNVRQYDPVKRTFVNSLNPIIDLQTKIITGDKGDNIPAIKPKCGPVTAGKIVSNDLLEKLFEENPEIKENYERNKVLIDLEMIPSDVEQSIVDAINNYVLEPFQSSKTFNFLIKHRLSSMLENVQEINGVFNRLNEFSTIGKSK
jgi:5'-3' exonuclease